MTSKKILFEKKKLRDEAKRKLDKAKTGIRKLRDQGWSNERIAKATGIKVKAIKRIMED